MVEGAEKLTWRQRYLSALVANAVSSLASIPGFCGGRFPPKIPAEAHGNGKAAGRGVKWATRRAGRDPRPSVGNRPGAVVQVRTPMQCVHSARSTRHNRFTKSKEHWKGPG